MFSPPNKTGPLAAHRHGNLPSSPAPCAVLNSGAPAREASGDTIVTFHEYEGVFAVIDICDDSTAWIRQRQRFPLVSRFCIQITQQLTRQSALRTAEFAPIPLESAQTYAPDARQLA